MSNLFGFEPPFAAFAASSVCSWKSPNTQAEKSSPGVAGFIAGAGGGAGFGASGDLAVSDFVVSGVVACARAESGATPSDTTRSADQNEMARVIRVSLGFGVGCE